MFLGEYRRERVTTSERKKTPSLVARCWDEISQRGYGFAKSLSGPRSLSVPGDKRFALYTLTRRFGTPVAS
jgi:hypothetical protein